MVKMRVFAVLALLGILFSCASSGSTNDLGLDAAIQQASKEINDSLPAGNKVALINFSSPSDVFSDYVLEEMSIFIVKEKKLVVVDRREIDLLRKEMNFQMSGEVSDQSAQEIGKVLGAQSIVSGSLVNMGDTYRFRTKVIEVNSAAIQASSSISFNDSPQIQHLLAQGKAASQTAPARPAQAAPASSGSAQAIPVQAVTSEQAPAAVRYKIGDTGPAGGLIFYDKGNNSGGWRYLEAAPVEAEFQAQWSVRWTPVENTQETIGSGRRNTQLIVEKFKQTSGEWDTAAQKCADLEFGGFKDWFIPSKAELDQMYGNLKRKNFGDFKNEWYWTSSNQNQNFPHIQNFGDGRMSWHVSGNRNYVRPIRQFPGS